MNISTLYNIYRQYPDIVTDTRKVIKGGMFFALKGDNFNGNKFAAQALDQGCATAVVDEPEYAISDQYVLVEDVLASLQDLASYHRSQLDIPILGLTGSNGKTTTKELLSKALSCKYNVLATAGNLNNHIGVPLTLLRINEQHDFAIIEMGTNSPGEIEFLCNICMPTHGLITNIGKAHLEGLINLDGVFREKTALYRSLQSSNGVIFYNTDDDLLASAVKDYSRSSPFSGYQVGDYTIRTNSSFPNINLSIKGADTEALSLTSQLYGEYNIINFVTAFAIGHYFGIRAAELCQQLSNYKAKNNRTQFVEFGNSKIYLDAYNANPSSVRAVIAALDESGLNNKVLILADMKELGTDSLKEHQAIIDQIQESVWHDVLLFGPEFGSIKADKTIRLFNDFKTLQSAFIQLTSQSSNILIKGSRSMALERLIPPIDVQES